MTIGCSGWIKRVAVVCVGIGSLVGASAIAGANELDPELPSFERVPGVSGSLKSMGSDTMLNVMTHWQEAFREFYPNVRIEVEGKGSSSGPPALIKGQAQFAPMSRAMKAEETSAFVDAFSYEPTQLRVGVDCLAIFVHKDCPLDDISLEDVERVFSVTSEPLKWSDLGVTDVRYSDEFVSLYGRNSASGTYGYFKEVALAGHDFKATVKEQAGSSGVVRAVGADPFGMGYSGIGFTSPNVKALRVSAFGDEAAPPDATHAFDGTYPLARFLYVYINHDPARALDPLRAAFVRFMLSRDGQASLLKDGYIALPSEVAFEELEKVGLDLEG
ncbi:MAG: phosphate ABC transporter substrate-binding protein [Planctomycetota bacterium]